MELTNLNSIVTATKEDLTIAAKTIVRRVTEGYTSPIAVIAQLKKVGKFTEAITEDKSFKESLVNELLKQDGNKAGYGNMEIAYSTTSRYDYSNDAKWVELNRQLKEREAFLKGLPSTGKTEIDEETGEFTRVYPPVKKTSDVIKATIK